MATTITNNEIQTGIVSYLKAISVVSNEVNSGLEIREDQWGGRDFTYPNIRVQLETTIPNFEDCGFDKSTFNILVFTEDDSSLNCDRIAGIVKNNVGTSFVSNSLRFFSVRVIQLEPAFRISHNTWRSQVKYQALVSQ